MKNNAELTISVITATYNQATFLPDCINSVNNSILHPLNNLTIEHIVVDDCSTDQTQQICQQSSTVKYHRLTENRGPSAARNLAIKLAKGNYIFVLDSDDVLLQRSLYHLYSQMLGKKASWIYTDFIRVDKNLTYLFKQDYYGWGFKNKKQMLNAIFNGRHFIQHNVMFKKSIYDLVGGYDENLRMAEDLDMYIRFLQSVGLPLYLPIISHLHRLHGANLSQGHDHQRHLEDCKLLAKKYNWHS